MYKFEKKKEKNLNKLKPSAKGKLTLTLWKGGYFIVEFYPLECMLLTDHLNVITTNTCIYTYFICQLNKTIKAVLRLSACLLISGKYH